MQYQRHVKHKQYFTATLLPGYVSCQSADLLSPCWSDASVGRAGEGAKKRFVMSRGGVRECREYEKEILKPADNFCVEEYKKNNN